MRSTHTDRPAARIAMIIAAVVTAFWLAFLATVAHGVAGANDSPPTTVPAPTTTVRSPWPTMPDTAPERHEIPQPEVRFATTTTEAVEEPTTTTVVVVRPRRAALPETS